MTTQDAAAKIEDELAKNPYSSRSLVKIVLVGEVDVDCEINTDFLKDMFEELLKQGSRKENMIAKMAGGAQMFVNQNTHNMLNIGQQNIQAVHELLAEWKIPLVAEDVGNNYGRTIEFDPATGELMIRTIGVGDTVI